MCRKEQILEIAWAAAAFLMPGILLLRTVEFFAFPPRIPMTFFGAILENTVRVQVLMDNILGTTQGLNAPFEYSLADLPTSNIAGYALAALLGKLAGSAGLGLMLAWLVQCMAAGLTAYACLRIAALPRMAAFLGGFLWALLPYALLHNIEAFDRVLWPAPFPLTLALLSLAGRLGGRPRWVRWLLVGGCGAGALCAWPEAWLVLFVLAVCLVFCVAGRQFQGARWVAAALLLCTAVVAFKYYTLGLSPEETLADSKYAPGLNVINVLALPDFDWTPGKLMMWTEEGFSQVNELMRGAVGFIGVVGALVLLGVLFVSLQGSARSGSTWAQLRTAAFLAFVVLLPAGLAGGYLALLPDAAAAPHPYRLLPALGFLVLYAFGVAAEKLREYAAGRLPRYGHFVGLGILVALALLGAWQARAMVNWPRVHEIAKAHHEEIRLVIEEVRQRTAQGSLIYQLPDRDVVRNPRRAFDNLTQVRPYLLEPGRRWSNAPMGRSPESAAWHKALQALPPRDMVSALMLAGFDGIWLTRKDSSITFDLVRSYLAYDKTELCSGPNDVYLFIDLSAARADLRRNLGEKDYLELQAKVRQQPRPFEPSDAPLPIGFGLVAYWPLNDAEFLMDYAGELHDFVAEKAGTVREAAGLHEEAVSLGGEARLHTVDRVLPDLLGPIDFSVSLWVRTPKPDQEAGLFGWEAENPPHRAVLLRLTQKNGQPGLAFVLRREGPGGQQETVEAFAPGALSADTWHHIFVVRAFGREASLFVDGVLVATTTDPGWDLSAKTRLFLSGAQPFAGQVDEVRIWSRTLGRPDIQRLVEAGRTPSP